MKKSLILVIVISFLLCSTNIYSERIYISRLNDTTIHLQQEGTGQYASDNCGPTSLGIVLNYLGYPYKSISWLRTMIRPFDGWVYTNEIEKYLVDNKIDYQMSYIGSENDIIRILSNGGMIILCLNISYISYVGPGDTGREYSDGTGHYIVISGYYKDDSKCYFEVLDPENKNVRYYKSEELIKAITSWWSWGFVFKQEKDSNM